METNKDYILREVAGEEMLIPTGKASQRLNGMIHLTGSATYIWKKVDEVDTLEQIISDMTKDFEIDEETAREDVYGFLLELYKRDMVRDIPELEELVKDE